MSDLGPATLCDGRYRVRSDREPRSGTQATVYICDDTLTGRIVACRVAKMEERESALAQWNVLVDARSHGLVRVYGLDAHEGQMVTILEEVLGGEPLVDWAAGKPLFDRLRSFRQAAGALLALFDAGSVHGDLFWNVLIDQKRGAMLVDVDVGADRSHDLGVLLRLFQNVFSPEERSRFTLLASALAAKSPEAIREACAFVDQLARLPDVFGDAALPDLGREARERDAAKRKLCLVLWERRIGWVRWFTQTMTEMVREIERELPASARFRVEGRSIDEFVDDERRTMTTTPEACFTWFNYKLCSPTTADYVELRMESRGWFARPWPPHYMKAGLLAEGLIVVRVDQALNHVFRVWGRDDGDVVGECIEGDRLGSIDHPWMKWALAKILRLDE